MSRTKEENFLIAVYRYVKDLEDPQQAFDPIPIGRSIGMNPKSVESMSKFLARGNFLRKEGEGIYSFQPLGEKLVRSLLGEEDDQS